MSSQPYRLQIRRGGFTLAFCFLFFTACEKKENAPEVSAPTEQPSAPAPNRPRYGGISIKRVVTRDLKKGQEGPTAKKGAQVSYKQTTWIYDPKEPGNKGQKVSGGDQKIEKTVLGKGQVLKGLEQGAVGMKKGGRRQLIIPPEQGYGDKGLPPHVFAGAILLTEIEVIDVR